MASSHHKKHGIISPCCANSNQLTIILLDSSKIAVSGQVSHQQGDHTKQYKTITGDITKALGTLRQALPGVMVGFSKLSQAAAKDAALDKKTKELIALALGVAAHCDGCIGFHTKALVGLGAVRPAKRLWKHWRWQSTWVVGHH